MCGISGFWGSPKADAQEILKSLNDVQWHRGPDAEGIGFPRIGELASLIAASRLLTSAQPATSRCTPRATAMSSPLTARSITFLGCAGSWRSWDMAFGDTSNTNEISTMSSLLTTGLFCPQQRPIFGEQISLDL
jgi:hypothetical protein